MADNRPSKTLTLESGRELTMPYLVFNDILRFVGTLEEAMTGLLTNQDTRDLVLRRVFTDSSVPVEDIKDLIKVEELEVDIFEIDEILGWVMEHITYFFMKTAERLQAGAAKFPEIAKRMSSVHFENGTTPSTP